MPFEGLVKRQHLNKILQSVCAHMPVADGTFEIRRTLSIRHNRACLSPVQLRRDETTPFVTETWRPTFPSRRQRRITVSWRYKATNFGPMSDVTVKINKYGYASYFDWRISPHADP